MRSHRRVFNSRWRAVLVLMLATSTVGLASEPVTFYGFDKDSYSPKAQEGLEEIFAGRLFHGAIPVAAAKLAFGALAGPKNSLDHDPGSPEGRFYATGRLPSPPSRTSGTDPSFGLGESVYDRDGSRVVGINCLACHAGVVNGQVVAGLINNHLNQSNPRKIHTRGDNFGPYAVWNLLARLSDPEKEGLTLAKGKTELQSLFASVELAPVD